MAEGFGCLIMHDGTTRFVEPNPSGGISHTTILSRLRVSDEDMHLRRFIRIEFRDWHSKNFHIDEPSSVPGWAESLDLQTIATNTLKKVRRIWNKKDMGYPEKLELISQIPGYVPHPQPPETANKLFEATVNIQDPHDEVYSGGHHDSPNSAMVSHNGERLHFRGDTSYPGWFRGVETGCNWHERWLADIVQIPE